MTDVEDCARYLRELASKADAPEVRNQIDACLEDYRSINLARAGALADLAMAIQRAEFPDNPLTDFIREWLNRRSWA
jgi:hypothetical protein